MSRVRFLSDSGWMYEADIDALTLDLLRTGYPMKGWPSPWRESPPEPDLHIGANYKPGHSSDFPF